MEIKVIETGKIVELSIRDIGTGVDWTEEIIGNNNGFGRLEDGYIKREYNDDGEMVYEANADTVEWWQDYIAGYDATEREITELANDLDVSRGDVRAYIDEAIGGYDMDAHRHHAEKAIEALRNNPSLLN